MPTNGKWWSRLALAGPAVLALGYLWGVVYSDTYLTALGFGSHHHPLSVQEAYVQAYMAGTTVAVAPFRWLVQLPTWVIVAALGVPIILAGIAGWRWDEAGVRTVRRSVPGTLTRWLGPRLRRAVSWALRAGLAVLAAPYAVVLIASLAVLSLAAPQWAAKANAEKVWTSKSFEAWNRATWTSRTGEVQSGFVYTCWERECALIDEAGRSFLVPVGDVHERSGRILGAAAGGAGGPWN